MYQSPKTPLDGLFAYTGDDDTEPIIIDGRYGDPHADDDTPDFIKQDDDGWIRLNPITRSDSVSKTSTPHS